jgi:hypothetical protein
MKIVHESGTINVPTSPKLIGDDDEHLREWQEQQTASIATASASDRMKLFLILFYDLCRYSCVLGIGACRVLIQHLFNPFNNRS